MQKLKTIFRWSLSCLLIGFLIHWGIDYAQCEALTKKHAQELLPACNAHTMVGPVDDLKVLSFEKGSKAKVYVRAGKANSAECGIVFSLFYNKQTQTWKIAHWHTVWSIGGSAEDFIWPYVR